MGAVNLSDNDVVIVGGLVVFFLFIGTLTPFINSAFSTSYNEINSNTIVNSVNENYDDFNAVTAPSLFLSIISMPVYNMGNIPFFLELLIFFPIRLVFWLLIARNIWIGGGA